MKRLIYLLPLMLLWSCFNEDEVYIDSAGNTINVQKPPGSQQVFNYGVNFDSTSSKGFDGIDFKEDGSSVITGENEVRKFILFLNSDGVIINEMYHDLVYDLHTPRFSGEDVVAISGSEVYKFNSEGRIMFSILNTKVIDDMNVNTWSPRFFSDVLTDINGFIYPILPFYDASFGENKTIVAKYASSGEFVCGYIIDEYQVDYLSGDATYGNLLFSAEENLYYMDTDCWGRNPGSPFNDTYFYNKNNVVYSYHWNNGKIYVQRRNAENGANGPEIQLSPFNGISVPVYGTNSGGSFYVNSQINTQSTGYNNVFIETFSPSGENLEFMFFDKSKPQIPLGAIQMSSGQYAGQYMIYAVTNNTQLTYIRLTSF